ncbi:MAG TPA: GTPase ObgE [Lentisphaeria bacterium]|nr:GTPase ObgE [Lentisphaeria bacterium]
MFVDRVSIQVTAGNGGNGVVSFRRERNLPRGGPDGGNGGGGGSVVLRANENVSCLAALKYLSHYEAENGRPGGGKGLQGRNGQDVVIKVPIGTLVTDPEDGALLADLEHDGDEYVAAEGGVGGVGNRSFASSTNRVPRDATEGKEGGAAALDLELKIVAGVGLVGYPNAGKSTLLSALTGADPETGAYPFTTLTPNVGVMNLPDYKTLTIADIPGLIEGAHLNVGLGHEFLRHIERTHVLAYVLDLSAIDGISPLDAFRSLQAELEHYLPGLSDRPSIVVANKTDGDDAAENLAELREALSLPIFPVCAVLEEGTDALRPALQALLKQAPG